MTQPFKTIIDYVAEYISKLPADHHANRAFGARLTYLPEDELAEESNIFMFRFPASDYTWDTADIMGDLVDVTTTNRNGICVLPAGGGAPDANMGCYYPYFVIRCRRLHTSCRTTLVYFRKTGPSDVFRASLGWCGPTSNSAMFSRSSSEFLQPNKSCNP